ncbi:hypothetical protein ACJQWK_03198 [Exserohilum turcicum]
MYDFLFFRESNLGITSNNLSTKLNRLLSPGRLTNNNLEECQPQIQVISEAWINTQEELATERQRKQELVMKAKLDK